MRVVIAGLGIQGEKRRKIAGSDAVALVDPENNAADYRTLEDVPLNTYNAAFLCTPDSVKIPLIRYLLENGKHVLVEKPLLSKTDGDIEALRLLAQAKGVTCYTAYNHRFEPNIARLRELVLEGFLGKIYSLRLYYGNGTARLVRESSWRDSGLGVLQDLGSHLLDIVHFSLGSSRPAFQLVGANRFENRVWDHAIAVSHGPPFIEIEMSLLMWRNAFRCDLIAENGSVHIDSLCKWGPASLTIRHRVLPAGRPSEEQTILTQADPTWALEYEHFKKCCRTGDGNIENDIWINKTLNVLAAGAGLSGESRG
ncbi:Gfo/Idh/MocA family oxidoreductase [Alphaproteobacteria bacterium]|nr:Gfo/Idh/MocA family oxidoreductase [Alphaproteobacteria bacterium]